MSRRSRMRIASDGKPSETRHLKRYADGRMTVREDWARIMFAGKRCIKCMRPPMCALKVFLPYADMKKQRPALLLGMAAANPDGNGRIPIYHTKFGPYIPFGETYACDACRPDVERELARHFPSWVLVEIDDGPDYGKKGRVMVDVPVDVKAPRGDGA